MECQNSGKDIDKCTCHYCNPCVAFPAKYCPMAILQQRIAELHEIHNEVQKIYVEEICTN